ncbi:type II restriction enzyme [Levilactobacillus enshiensis]|uniref:type II restriction enzyme n=1 Tax=Levilactobacillus enshiensis TaxID=2590213 RepID=UPI00117A9CAA|nr:hypothetical protein [Levilactobacillus enshiensis]
MARGTNKANKNEVWQEIFDIDGDKISDSLEKNGYFDITAPELKEFSNKLNGPDVRNLAKFDRSYSLPAPFKTGVSDIKHFINIMPLGYIDKVYTYRLGRFNAYANLDIDENKEPELIKFPNVQTITPETIPSENTYIDAAFSSGMLNKALQDGGSQFLPVLHGRMGSGPMEFNIGTDHPQKLSVNSAQIEIDATFENDRSIVIIEAKAVPEADFLVRQLYYPYYVIRNRGVTKPVRPAFLSLLAGTYYFNEYKFTDPNNYSTIKMVSQRSYRFFDNSPITLGDIVEIYNETKTILEPKSIVFPQANSYLKLVKTLTLLNDAYFDEDNDSQGLHKRDIASVFGYAERQGDYYGNLILYLNLCVKQGDSYLINENGRTLLRELDTNEGKISLITLLLQHHPFRVVFKYLLDNPQKRTHALSADDKKILAGQVKPFLNTDYNDSTMKRRIESTDALVRSVIFDAIDAE